MAFISSAASLLHRITTQSGDPGDKKDDPVKQEPEDKYPGEEEQVHDSTEMQSDDGENNLSDLVTHHGDAGEVTESSRSISDESSHSGSFADRADVCRPEFVHSAAEEVHKRAYPVDEFDKKTAFRDCEIITTAGDATRSFFVNISYLAEISDYFRDFCMQQNKIPAKIRIREDSAEFLLFLRAVIPSPLHLSLDEFNVKVLAEMSLGYGVPFLFADCEKFIRENLEKLEDDVIVPLFRAVYRSKTDPQRTWLCEHLFAYITDHIPYDQFHTFADLDKDLVIEMLTRRCSALTQKRNSEIIVKNPRKREGPAIHLPLLPLKKPNNSTLACPRCAQEIRNKNARHGKKFVETKCVNCKRFRCEATCQSASTCKVGGPCDGPKKEKQEESNFASAAPRNLMDAPRTLKDVLDGARGSRSNTDRHGSASSLNVARGSAATPTSIIDIDEDDDF